LFASLFRLKYDQLEVTRLLAVLSRDQISFTIESWQTLTSPVAASVV